MTQEQLDGLSAEQRAAWIASLSEDQQAILAAPSGYRYTLVAIAEAKWALSGEIPQEYRLRFLKFLEFCEGTFSREAIVAVQPMPDEGREITKEARKLGDKWLDAVARWEVFNAFVLMNPSMLVALKTPRTQQRYVEIGGAR